MSYFEIEMVMQGVLDTDEPKEALLEALEIMKEDVEKNGLDSRMVGYVGRVEKESHPSSEVEALKGNRQY